MFIGHKTKRRQEIITFDRSLGGEKALTSFQPPFTIDQPLRVHRALTTCSMYMCILIYIWLHNIIHLFINIIVALDFHGQYNSYSLIYILLR